MAQRREWRFKFQAVRLTVAAEERAAYHQERLSWWQEELARIEPEAMESVKLVAYAVTGGNRLDAHFEGDIANRYHECQEKIAGHQRDLDEFRRWERAFSLAPGATLFDLDVDDVAHFAL